MTMSATDTIKKDVHCTNWGSIKHLNLTSYIDWKMNIKSILKSMRVWKIDTGEEKEPTETPPTLANLELAIKSFKQRKNDEETLLHFSINSTIQKQLRHMEDPAEMRVILGNQFNRTYSQMQHSIYTGNLYTVKPYPGEHISCYTQSTGDTPRHTISMASRTQLSRYMYRYTVYSV